MDWSDLGNAFGQLLGDVVGDQESADNLPPPAPKIPLSQRLQRFSNTLLGPMQKAWTDFSTEFKQGAGADWDDNPNSTGWVGSLQYDLPGPIFGGPVIDPSTTNDHDITARGYARQYMNYYQWVYPYIESIRDIIDGKYTGQDYKDILEFLQVTEDDFNGSLDSYDKFVKPWMDRAFFQEAAFLRMRLTPSVAPPVLPKDATNFLKRLLDNSTGNSHGENPNVVSDILTGLVGTLILTAGLLFVAAYLITSAH